MAPSFNLRGGRRNDPNELYPDYPDTDRTSNTSSTTPMLRDADLRDNFNSNADMNTQHQHDAPTSHHRQPSHHREYHYSRRRRDDAGSPPPIQVQGQGQVYSQAQAQSSSSHSHHSHFAAHTPAPPPPRIQQQASGSNSSSSHGHTHSQSHSQSHSHSHVHYHPAPPQIYYPAPSAMPASLPASLPGHGPYPRDPVTVSPLSTSPSRSRNASPFDPTPAPAMSTGDSNLSLAVNYIPSKFSNPRLSSLTTSSAGGDHGAPAPGVTFASGSGAGAGPRRRRTGSRNGARGREESLGPGVPKMGGGVDAFRSGEARIGGEGDEDEGDEGDADGEEVDERGAGRGRKSWFAYSRTRNGARGRPGHPKTRKARWNGFKWCLFVANLALTLYSLTALIFCLLTWFNVWAHADVIRAGNHTELALSTLAAASGILAALIGWVGLLMNNRSFLAIYTFLLWVVFLLILVPGYMTYRRRTFNLEGKINAQWSKHLGESGRLRIQNQLQCCGYFSPFVEATVSQTCYARSTLPGCKASYLTFERHVLKVWYEVAFGLVPLHVAVVVAGLLCANHVTYRFGKGMMPKAYRLSVASMAVIMDNYANQLAEQYGPSVAQDVLTRSRSNLNLLLPSHPGLPTLPSTTSLKTDKAVAGSVLDYEAVAPNLGWRDKEKDWGRDKEKDWRRGREKDGWREREKEKDMRELELGRPPVLRRGETSASGSRSGSGASESAPLI